MAILIVLLSLFPISLVGCLILRLASSRYLWNWRECLALGFALGSGLTAFILFGASFFTPAAMTVTLVLVGAGAIISLATWFWKAVPSKKSEFAALHFDAEWLWFLPLCIWVLIVTSMAFSTDLGFDGLVTWGFKAKVVFLNGGWVTDYFKNPWHQVSHLDYPLLIPSLEAWAYAWLSKVDEASIKVLFPVFYVALLSLFYDALRVELDPSGSLVFTMLLALTPYLASLAAISGYADLPLMLYVFGSAAFMYRWIKGSDKRLLLLSGILSALGVWTKREGIVYWGVNLFFLLLELLRTRRSIILARVWLVPGIILLAPWFGFLAVNGVANSDFAPLSMLLFMTNLDRIPVIMLHLLVQFASVGEWGVLWLLWLILLPAWWKRRDWAGAYLICITAAPLGFLALTFVFSLWIPFTAHLGIALDRLVLQVVPLSWFFIALQVPGLGAWLTSLLHKNVKPEVES